MGFHSISAPLNGFHVYRISYETPRRLETLTEKGMLTLQNNRYNRPSLTVARVRVLLVCKLYFYILKALKR